MTISSGPTIIAGLVGAPPAEEYSGIVSLDELLDHMSGLQLPAEHQKRAARRVILGVQRSLERRLNRPVELTQVREALTADTAGYLNPTVTPIRKIINKTPVGDANYDPGYNWAVPYIPIPQVRDDLVSPNVPLIDKITVPNMGAPLVMDSGVFSAMPGQVYVLEYIGGYDGANDMDLKVKIMDVAARSVRLRHDDSLSLRQGAAEQAENPDPRDLDWTENEIKALSRLKRRVIATTGPATGWQAGEVDDYASGYYW